MIVPYICPVSDLPLDFATLRCEAASEGYRFMERLYLQWTTGQMRFDKKGEALLMASMNGVTAAIGGVTIDPQVPNRLRMRRFYVRPQYRHQGVGRRLATALLEHAARHSRTVTVNAGTAEAGDFWSKLGFAAYPVDGLTHLLEF